MSEEKEMSFLGHIGELRAHLIRSIIAIIVGAILIGFNIEWIIDNIFFGPTRNDFLTFRVVNHFSRLLLGHDSINLPQIKIQQNLMFQQFNVMMVVSIFGGLVIAFPFIVWEIWKFISPALHEKERKNSIFVINGIWFLFMLGVFCGYYLILPFAVNFAMIFKISKVIIPFYSLSDYTTVFLQIVLGMGVIFLFPMVVYLLTSIGILTPKFLRTYRRHAIVVIMVVAAIITPADVLSMMAAAMPLVVLYEMSVLMSVYVSKKIEKKERALEKAKNN